MPNKSTVKMRFLAIRVTPRQRFSPWPPMSHNVARHAQFRPRFCNETKEALLHRGLAGRPPATLKCELPYSVTT